MRRALSRPHDDRGAMAILIAVLTVVLFGFVAVVVDLGVARVARQDARKAADLAALAGGQDLPNTAAAVATVADYLDVDPGVLTDGDPKNGQVTFASGSSGVANTRMTVVTPGDRVSFAFAGALPGTADFVDVDASATVELAQPIPPYNLPVLPVIVPDNADSGTQCWLLRDQELVGPLLQALLLPPLPPLPPLQPLTIGDCSLSIAQPLPLLAGYDDYTMARVGRGRVQGRTSSLVQDIRRSLDHQPGQPIPGGSCDATGPMGSVVDVSPFTAAFTCVEAWGPDKRETWDSGLVGPNPSTCVGRLVPAALLGDEIEIDGCPVVRDRWTDYTSTPGPSVDQDIVSDPRFGLAMVVQPPTPAATERKAINAYVGVYIRDIWTSDLTLLTAPPPPAVGLDVSVCGILSTPCTGKILSARVELFPVSDINGILAPNTGPNVPYEPNGPKTVVLID